MSENERAVRYVGAAAGMVPLVGPLVQELTVDAANELIREIGRARSVALKAAERSSGMTRENIAQTLADNPHILPLACRILWHVGMTGQDEILAALGGILGSVLREPDNETADLAELYVLGLGNLRRAHLMVLRVMRETAHARVTPADSISLAEQIEAELTELPLLPPTADGDDGLVEQPDEAWNAASLTHASGLDGSQVQLALGGLVAAGYVVTAPTLGVQGYLIAPPGRTILEVIERYQLDAPADPHPL